MNFEKRRNNIINDMRNHSIFILYSGIEVHVSCDEYYPFEANRNFFYLTGLRRDKMCLVMIKDNNNIDVRLFIEKADPKIERWVGHKLTKKEASNISDISFNNIDYIEEVENYIDKMVHIHNIRYAYFDMNKNQEEDMDDYNMIKAMEFEYEYPDIKVKDSFNRIAKYRLTKDEDEIKLLKEAIRITDLGLQNVMKNLKPGMKEYQVQADFEYMIHYQGAEGVAFPTIAGSGSNGTMMHYITNQDTCKDGDLILLDLGARYEGYNADITRTYPINGKFTNKQRAVYDIVLAANQRVKDVAEAGMSLAQLNHVAEIVLAKGCMELGLIKEMKEIKKYYMHSVSHELGIDVHDVMLDYYAPLESGSVISDEPGLYIDEWGIGIRIEDDLLIKENGCECLSEGIIRTADEIEEFMKGSK